MQAAHSSRRSSRRRARALEIAEITPRSTATICLDGTDFYKVLQSYLVAMKGLDDWLRAGTEVVDASCFFGPGHDVVRTREGVFTMVYEFEGKCLTVPIEGTNLYLRGFENDHGRFELDFGDDKFIHSKACTILDIGVNYRDILDDSLERTLTGMWPLRNAVRELCKYRGGPAAHVAPFVGTVAIHTSEAARTGPVHSFICRSLVDITLSRLNKAKGLVIWIRKYKALSFQLMVNIDRMYNGEAPRPIKHFGLNIDLHDLAAGLRVCYKEAYTAGVFKMKSPENKRGPRGTGSQKEGTGRGEELVPHKIQKGLFTTSSPQCSYVVKCLPDVNKGYLTPTISSYTVKCAMVLRKTIQIVESPCIVKPNPTIEKGSTLKSASYGVWRALSPMVQRATFDRAKASSGVNCSLRVMERLSGQKDSIIISSEVNHSCMSRITSTHSRAHVFTAKSVDLGRQRTMLGPGRVNEKLTKLGSTLIHQNNWANNRRPASRMQLSINLLSSNLSGSFSRQKVRRYMYRALRLFH